MLPELLLESAPLLELELLPELLGSELLPLEALPFGQSAPTQFDELPDALPVADALPDADVPELGEVIVLELGDVELELVEDGAVVPAPDEAPAAVLLPELLHAAATNAAATATLIALKLISSSFG